MPILVVLGAVAVLFGTGLLGALLRRTPLGGVFVYGLTLAACLAAAFAALSVLMGGAPSPVVYDLPLGVPWVKAHFRLDLLSSFFLVVVTLVSAMASLYGWQYGHHEKEPGRVLPFYPIFIAGMSLVTIADDAFAFLAAWELMSLASWLLVLASHKDRETQHAAYVYIVMASVGTLALFLAFGLLAAEAGTYSFGGMRRAVLTPLAAGGVFFLALFGAGAKAGLVPLHVWLPLAHPAAPSHVSALMSGVMTKVALYGLIRILFDLVGGPDWWWGTVLLVVGGVTALLGVLYAVMQTDLKKLLAYSTVENVGIITLALGLAMGFHASELPALAGLALVAALFHVFNHAVFKSLMFLGAGAVLTATGERDMEKMGGLIHRMPVTAFVCLVGAATIAALPPFAGFASEWLVFQALMGGAEMPQWIMKLAVPLVGAMLALAAAFAAVAFVKVYGVVFLGRPRSGAAAKAHEAGAIMLAPMVLLALLCALAGVLPTAAVYVLRPVAQAVLGSDVVALPHSTWFMLVPGEVGGSSYSGLIFLAAVAVLAIVLVFVIHHFASSRVRRGAIWDCGFPCSHPATQYSASSFAQPVRRVFGTLAFAAKETVDMPQPGELRAGRFSLSLKDPVWDAFFATTGRWVGALAGRFERMQSLGIRHYLSLMFATLVLLLILVAVAP